MEGKVKVFFAKFKGKFEVVNKVILYKSIIITTRHQIEGCFGAMIKLSLCDL